MPYANPEAKRAYDKLRYIRNREEVISRAKQHYADNVEDRRYNIEQWQKNNPKKHAYNLHKANAKARGIEFLFSYVEWVNFWGDKFSLRGIGGETLCMARKGDIGPYSAGNVELITKDQNVKDGFTNRSKI